jgi:alanyl-tRNA synthetase
VHLCEIEQFSHPDPLAGMPQATAVEVCHHQFFNKPAVATIDIIRRYDIMRNHTATHLLHAALRNTLGTHVAQAGSLVNPDQLRFDYTPGKAVTPDQLREIEHIVNSYVLFNVPVVTYVDIPIAEARARGAMALFGEKYGDKVRMVEISEFSRELCGGTHVASTGEIGYFKIVSEASAAAGTRRIEARTGFGAHRWVAEQTQLLHEASAALKTHPRDLVHTIEKTLDQLKEERKRREQLAQQSARSGATVDATTIGSIELAIQELPSGDPKDAERVADVLTESQPNRVGLVVLHGESKVTFVCKVGKVAMASGAHAGNLVREVAKVAGGGGGGGPQFATAGGRDPSKLGAAIERAKEFLAETVK